jgi:hypothetical protein
MKEPLISKLQYFSLDARKIRVMRLWIRIPGPVTHRHRFAISCSHGMTDPVLQYFWLAKANRCERARPTPQRGG